MAGNRVEYIIDLVVKDKQLRQQMAKINWEEILGTKGKGMSEAFAKGTKGATDQIQNMFRGINIDWSKILGEDDLVRLESILEKTISKNVSSIKDLISSGDTSGIDKTISGLVKLSNEFNSFKKSANASGGFEITGTMQAALKTIGATDEQLKDASESLEKYKKLVSAFKGNVRIDPNIKNDIAGLTKELEKLIEEEAKLSSSGQQNSVKYGATVKKLMAYENARLKLGASPYRDFAGARISGEFGTYEKTIDRLISRLDVKISEIEQKLSGIVNESFAKKISDEISNIQIKLTVSDSAKEELKSKINTFVDEINNGAVKPAQVQIGYTFTDSGAKDGAAKNIANIDVGKLKEMLQSEIDTVDGAITELKGKIADYEYQITQLAETKGTPHKTAIGQKKKAELQLKEFEKQKQANEYLMANINDEGVQRALTSTLNDLKAIRGVITSQTSAILSDTLNWRQQMINAFHFGKGDVDFNFSIGKIDTIAETLLDDLNAFFADNMIDININKEKLKNDIAEVLGTGVSLGGSGGVATIDPKEFAAAVMMGIKAAFTGDTTLFDGKGETKGTTTQTSNIPTKKPIYLDPQDPYNAAMAKEFIELAKYAQGTTASAKKVKDFFDTKLYEPKTPDDKQINLKSIANGESVMEALDALARVIEKGGITLDDQFGELVKNVGKNKLLSNFKTNLSELLYTQNIQQKTMSADEISRQSIDTFVDFSKKQQLVSGISQIKNLKPENLSSLKAEDVEGWASIASGISKEALESGNVAGSNYYNNIVNLLNTLKIARDSAGDVSDEAQQQQLIGAVSEFKNGIEQTYTELLNYVRTFDMHAYVKGRKPMRVSGGSSGRSLSRVLRAIDGDWSKLEDVTLQRMPNTAAIGVMSKREEQRLLKGSSRLELLRAAPDRTDVLNKDTSISEFQPKEGTSKRWKDSTTAEAQASARETASAKLVEEAQKRATSLVNTEAELERQIQAKREQKVALENEVAKNQKQISKLIGDDGRKIAGAQTRLRNAESNVTKTSQAVTEAQMVLEKAQREKEAADRALQEIQKSDYSAIDAQDAKIAQYKAWMKAPVKYRKDIIGDIKIDKDGIYRPDSDHIYYKELYNSSRELVNAEEQARKTEGLLAEATHKVERLQQQTVKFGETPDLKKQMDAAIRRQKELQRELSTYQSEIDQSKSILKDVQRKMAGTTAQDRADFAADVKRKIGGYYDEYGDFHKGKLQHAEDHRTTLGTDSRGEVRAQVEQANSVLALAQSELEKAQSEHNKALQKQKEVKKSDEYVKKAEKINGLVAKNDQLAQEITALNEGIQSDIGTKNDVSTKAASETSKARLTATEGLKSSIDALITRQDTLEQEILSEKAKADAIDESVTKRMQQSAHKTPKSKIGYSKKDQQVIDKYYEHENRAQYLSKVAENSLGEKDFVPTNLTATMQKAIESIVNSRRIIQSLGENTNDTIVKLGLDKFTSEADLKKEVKTRLDAGVKSETKIPSIITEYYNKILNEGQDGALQWLEKTISSSLQNIKAQKIKLTSLSQTDATKAAELQPIVDDLNVKLPQMYRERITTWVKSIQQKISYLGTEGLSDEDTMLAIKEIEELGKITNNAFSNYNKNYVKKWNDKIQAEEKTLTTLQQSLEAANKAGNLDEISAIEEKIIKSQNLIDEYVHTRAKLLFLTPAQEALIKDVAKYSYSRELNKGIKIKQDELKGNRTDTEQQILERSAILETRMAELLNQIKTAPSDTSTEGFKKELEGINAELAKYQQYFTMLNVNTLFADDVEFAKEYETKLAEIIKLEQQLDLAKAIGAPTSDLMAQINVQQGALDQSIYDKLQTKRQGLLSDIGTFAKEGKDTHSLEESLKSVNAELTKYELVKRRIAQSDVTKELSLYGANENVMKTYIDLTKEEIRLENELAEARAKSQDVKNDQAVNDAKSALSRHRTSATKKLRDAINQQATQDAESSARVQALEYLRATEEAYQTVYEQIYTSKGRIKRVEGKISDIAPDKSYWNSGLYKSHINTVKGRMVDEYIHSDQLKSDRDAGYAKVETEMKSYLEGKLGPEAAQQVLYQLMQSVAKGGDKIDSSKLMDAFVNLQKTSEEYAQHVATLRANEKSNYDKEIAPYAEQRDSIVDKATHELDLIRTASEKDYIPLQTEMDKIRSRVDVASIEKEFNQILKDASKRDKKEGLNKLKSKLMSVARSYGADTQELDDLYNVIDSNISNIRHNKTQGWISDALPRIFGMDEGRVREQARANLAKQEEAKIDRANADYIKQDAQITTRLAAKTQESINKYLDSSLSTAVKSLLSNVEGIKDAEEIANKLNELIEKYVRNLVSDYAQGLSVGKNMPSGEEIRKEIESGLLAELDILMGHRPDIKPGLAQFEENAVYINAQRKKAIDFGDIGRKEAVDADILQQQAAFTSRITVEKEKQAEITAEIARLEKEGGKEERIAELNMAFDKSQEAIDTWQMLINNRDNLIDLQHQIKADEKAEKTYTPEQQRLWYTNALEAAKLNLDSEDPTKKRIAEENVARYTDLLNRLEAKIAEQEPEEQGKGGIIGQLASLLKGAGGITLDASGLASQATLEQIAMAVERILITLGGDVATSIVKDPEMEAKVARMRELEEKYGGKPGQKIVNKSEDVKTTKKTSETDPMAKEMINKIKAQVKNEKDLPQLIKNLVGRIKPENKGTKEDTEDRFRLHRALSEYQSQHKNENAIKGVETYKNNKTGDTLHSYDKLLEHLGIANVKDVKDMRVFESTVDELVKAGFKQLENEKAKTAETAKQVENEKKEITSKTPIDANESWKEIPNYKATDETFKSLQEKAIALKGELNTLYDEGNADTEKFIQKQVELSRVMALMRKVYAEKHPEVYGDPKDKESMATARAEWEKVLTTSARGRKKTFDSLDGVPLTSINKTTFTKSIDKLNGETTAAKETAKAKQQQAQAETKITEEKEKQATADGKIQYDKDDYNEYKELSKATKDYKGGQVVRNETDGLSTGLAKDETLMKILDAINNIVKNGVTTRSKTQAKKDNAVQANKTEADLIRERALTNEMEVRRLSAGKANLHDKYAQYVDELNKAVSDANKEVDDKKKAGLIKKVKATADRVTAFGRNIIRDTEEWEYKSAQGTVLKSFKNKKNIDQAYMENLAKQNAGVNKGQNQYKFLNFDGNTLTYQLTDIEGKVRQVTMEWNAFNREIAITSDKSLNKFAGLAGKVDSLNTKFAEAKEIGYLHEEDKDLQAYYEQLKKIDELIKSGASFAEVDKARGEALNLGGFVNAKIGKTKRLYNESEFGKVDNQRRKIIDTFGSQEAFDESELGIVQQYKQAYLELQNTYKTLHTEKMTLTAKDQEALRQQTVGVESLGRKVIRQAQEIQTLNQAVEKSGSYEDKYGNEILLGDTKGGLSETEAEVGNLKNTMLDFAKNGLGHANIENVKFNKNTQTLTYNQRINKETVAEMEIQYKKATNTLYAYNKEEKKSLTGWKGFMRDMKTKGRSIFSYLTYTTSIYRLISVVRQGVTYVKEIDAAMLELRKVTDETDATYNRFLDTASKVASKVGSTTKEVVSSTADWARLGYTIQEATQLAETTQVLMNVSEFTDVATATDALISSVQAFKYTAEESMDVVDILNTIGNNYAISTADLATSLTKSSGSLVAANGTLEEAVALTATANTIIQDADVVGTALKTVAMRLRGTDTKTMEEEGLETDGMVTSKSKLQGKIKALSGVDILTDTGAYKSTYQILSEIANVWEDISDIDQAALLELLAGKRAGSVMSAILQNPQTLKDAFESANNAAGSAWTENEKYLDSIQGKMDLFTNSVQTMWTNAMDSEVIKFFVDFGRVLIEIVDNIGLLKTILIGIATYAGVKHFKKGLLSELFSPDNMFGNIESVTTHLDDLTKQYNDAEKAYQADPTKENKKKRNYAKHKMDRYSNQTKGYRDSYQQQSDNLDSLKTHRSKLSDELKMAEQDLQNLWEQGEEGGLDKEFDEASKKVDNLKREIENTDKQIKDAEVSLGKFSNTTNTMGSLGTRVWNNIKVGAKVAAKAIGKIGKAAIESYVMMQAMGLVFDVFSQIFKAWSKSGKSAEKLWEKFENLNSELDNAESNLRSLEGELDTTQDRIDELMAQGKLSFTDQEELDKLRAQSEELKTQISLAKTLKENLQIAVNQAAINATGKYLTDTSFTSETTKSERVEKSGSTGQSVGTIVGYAASGLIAKGATTLITKGTQALATKGATAIGAKIGTTLGTFAGPIGSAIGLAVGTVAGGLIGKVIGEKVAGADYEKEQTVQEAIDNMDTQRAALVKARDDAYKAYAEDPTNKKLTEKFDVASSELATYDQNMAKHISQIQEAYNAIDVSQLNLAEDSDKAILAQKQRLGDILDTYNISMGGDGAKSNAISRIFGSEEASDQLHLFDKQIKALVKSGEEFDFYEMFDSANLDDTRQRLEKIGISITDLKYYYLDLAKAEEEAEEFAVYDAIKSIATLTDKVDSLKNAFAEFNEEGFVSAKTLVELEETFGSLGDIWEDYVNIMATGVATTKEATVATQKLIEELVVNSMMDGPIKDMKEYVTLISQLSSMGVNNPKEFVDAMEKRAAVEGVANDVNAAMNRKAELEKKRDEGTWTAAEKKEYNEKYKGKTEEDFYQQYVEEYEKEYDMNLDDAESRELIEKRITMEKAKQAETEAQTEANKYDEAVRKQEEANRSAQEAQEILDIMEDPDVYLYDEDVMKKYGLSHDFWNGWTYKGKNYGSYEELQEALQEEVENAENIELPTKPDVEGAEEEAERAEEEYQKALDKAGLKLDIELVEASQAVDDIQSVYDTLTNAQKEYNEQGYFSVDTMQSLLALEPKYLALLYDENGNLNLNKQALLEVAKARIIDLGIKQKSSLVNTALSLSETGTTEALMQHIQVTGEAIKANDAYIESTLKTIKANLERRKSEGTIDIDVDAYMKGLNSQLDAIDRTTNIALNNISSAISSAGSGASKTALEKIQEKYERQIKNLEGQQTWIENEIEKLEAQEQGVSADYYEKQINLEEEKIGLYEKEREELLKLERTDEVADAIWEVEHAIQESTLSLIEFRKAIAELYATASEKITDAYDRKGQLFDDRQSFIENEISIRETKGELAPISAYDELIDIAKQGRADAEEELNSQADLYWQGVGDYNKKLEAESPLKEFGKGGNVDLLNRPQIDASKLAEAGWEDAGDGIATVFTNTFSNEDGTVAINFTPILPDGSVLSPDELQSYAEDVIDGTRQDDLGLQIGSSFNGEDAIQQASNAAEEIHLLQEAYYAEGQLDPNSEEALDILEKIRQKRLDMQDFDKQEAEAIEKKKDAYIAYYDKMMEAYSHRNDFFQSQSDYAQSYIDRLGVLNINVPDEAYDKMAEIQELSNNGLREQLAFANSELANLEANGIDKNDPRYIEKFKETLELERQIYEGETKVLEYHQQIIDNHLDRFNQVVDRINHSISQLENVSGLISDEDVANEDGTWTAEGLTQAGMAMQQMEYNKGLIAEYSEEMAYLDEQFKAGKISEKEYTEKMQELQNGQWDAINAYKSAEDAIVDLNEARIDMIEDGLNKEMEAYQELIDLKKEELDAERDLYDFRKDIQKQTKDIAALERRIASMSGSTDASTIAERTKLEAELREAREGLDDTYYGHAMDSQSNALDDEMEHYENSANKYIESLRESIKDTKLLIENTCIDVMANADIVLSTINGLSSQYGFTIEPNLKNPWINASKEASDFKTNAGGISSLIGEGGIITVFGSEENKKKLSGVFGAGSSAASQFSIDVGTHMGKVERTVNSYTSKGMEKYLGDKLKAPWDEAGNDETSGPKAFSKTTASYMDGIITYAQTNYKEQLKTELNYPWDQANGYTSWGEGVELTLQGVIDKANEAKNAVNSVNNVNPPSHEGNGSGDGSGNKDYTGGGRGLYDDPRVTALQEVLRDVFGSQAPVDGDWGPKTEAALRNVQARLGITPATGKYTSDTREAMVRYISNEENGLRRGNGSSMNGQMLKVYKQSREKLPAAFHAKGTLGTTHDQLAITDESWIGEEITLAAGKNGQLQYLKKGSAVMPADISKNLVEWGKLNPNMMNVGGGANFNMISNAINKPELNFSFDSLVHVDNCSQDTLKDLEKMVDTKITQFNKQLNQSLRRFK